MTCPPPITLQEADYWHYIHSVCVSPCCSWAENMAAVGRALRYGAVIRYTDRELDCTPAVLWANSSIQPDKNPSPVNSTYVINVANIRDTCADSTQGLGKVCTLQGEDEIFLSEIWMWFQKNKSDWNFVSFLRNLVICNCLIYFLLYGTFRIVLVNCTKFWSNFIEILKNSHRYCTDQCWNT